MQIFKHNKLSALILDIIAIPIAWYFAYWLRYNLQPFPTSLGSFYSLSALSILILLQTGCYYFFKVYRGLWSFFSIKDVLKIIKSTLVTVIISVPILFAVGLFYHVPRSILPLYAISLVIFLCSSRLLTRLYFEYRYQKTKNQHKNVLIIGAGQAGESLIRDLKRNAEYFPIGLIDDDVNKLGVEIHGVKVIGAINELISIAKKYQVELIFIAIPSASPATVRRIVTQCEQTKIPFRILPSIAALASGRVEVNFLRAVSLEDLLGREQVELCWDKITGIINNKRIIVTGGGGSIGSELCRQILTQKPHSLLIIDNSEFNLYKIQQELRDKFPTSNIQVSLNSIIDSVAINYVFDQFCPHIVFHAAAYKHVPMLEDQIRIAVQNNILGTKTLAEASVALGVEKFILISTDKAVNPTNVMGTTKRVAEIYCQNLNSQVDTLFITVRFGNVLGSTGSVIPLFQKQLEAGGPLTVTHRDVQRYFMTIPEASQLILQAMANGKGGEIFVLDMGEPIKISYLAEQMIRLAGKEPYQDIQITYTGLRPGEKLFEELFHASEELEPTEHQKLLKAKFRELEWSELVKAFHRIEDACFKYNEQEIIKVLKSLVPESSFCV